MRLGLAEAITAPLVDHRDPSQPIHIFEAMSGKPILSLLRPGKRPSGKEVARVLRHVVHCIRKRWPNVRILVRGDSHYLSQETLDFLQASSCDYILGLAISSTLEIMAITGHKSLKEIERYTRAVNQKCSGAPMTSANHGLRLSASKALPSPLVSRLIWLPPSASSRCSLTTNPACPTIS